ncbi:hypothetical protein [Virgibacillus siamensis]|uniref:hypothetical protein n=1 Tax=Virgibacillus siamensis TaxID=480071 RepID=UPI000986B33F|nr:hypothetical protein [Virgibacillus siamensis]
MLDFGTDMLVSGADMRDSGTDMLVSGADMRDFGLDTRGLSCTAHVTRFPITVLSPEIGL